jgi:hypothetical protein
LEPDPQIDRLRFAGIHDPRGEVRRVRDLRAAESPVDHLVPGQVLRERLPQPDVRRSDEEQRALWRRMRGVRLLERRDVLFPFREIVRGRIGATPRVSRQQEQEQRSRESRADEHGLRMRLVPP